MFETKLRGQLIVPLRAMPWSDRFAFGRQEVTSILAKIWPYLLVGIGVGAAIHGWVPEGFFVRWAGQDNLLAVPIAVVLGIPLYSNAAGIMPLAQLGMDDPVEKVTDCPTIVSYGVMSTPALAVDGEVKVAGRVPTVKELKRLLSEHSLSHLG